MRNRPEQYKTPGRRRGRCALPPSRLPVCGRNAECHTPLVSGGGCRSRWLGRLETSVGAARRRRLAPSAQEPNKAHRRRFGRRTRPEAAGEVATSTRRHRIRRRRADGRAVIKEMRLLTQRRSEPQTFQKIGGRFTLGTGRPPEKIGARGERKTWRFAFPLAPHGPNTFRPLEISSLV